MNGSSYKLKLSNDLMDQSLLQLCRAIETISSSIHVHTTTIYNRHRRPDFVHHKSVSN